MKREDCRWCQRENYQYLNDPLHDLIRHREECEDKDTPSEPDSATAAINFPRLKTLAEARAIMLEYVKMKIDEDDLHAAIDGLMDMRELDTEIKVLREMESK